MKHYKIALNPSAIELFLIIMLPNFYWLAVPAAKDILRAPSVTESLDAVASIFQIIMIAALCLTANKSYEKVKYNPLIAAVTACICLYYAMWVCYYFAIINAYVILGLCATPCIAFLLFSIDRKNIFAIIASSVFLCCHLTYGIINFIV